MKFGLQLYNFRQELSEDFRGTMKEIAKLGFDGVEFANKYGDMEPEELAAFLKELNLECAGTMFKKDNLLDASNSCYEYALKLNSPAVTISAMVDFVQEWQTIAEICRKIGDNAAARGTIFSYHNHWAEFADVDGMTAMDRILAATDPKRVLMEPDVCWLTRGGIKPAEFLQKYAGRIRQVHMKDSKVPEEREQLTELGCGVVDLIGVYQTAGKIGAQWLIYEQDITTDPFRSAEISLKYMKQLR